MDHIFGKQGSNLEHGTKLENRTNPVYVEQNKIRIWNPEQRWNMENISKKTRKNHQH